MMPNKLALVFSLLCLLLPASPGRAQQADVFKKGVVTISAHVAGRVNHGTGFIVKMAPDTVYIVTASHVVEGAERVNVRFFNDPAHDVAAKVYEQEGGNPRGIAILTATVQPAWVTGVSVLSTSPNFTVDGGDDILVVGSPPDLGPWTVMKSFVKLKEGRDTIISGGFDAGFSGSPVLKGGQVIGMLTETTAGSGYAVPGVIVLAYLDGENVSISGTDEVQEGISARLLLKDYGINYDEESFLASIKRRDLEIAELFLKAKPKWCDTREGDDGETALMLAAHDGNADIVNALIRAGADVSATDNNGLTALSAAAEGRELTSNAFDQGHVRVAKALMAAGADIHAASNLGTPLQVAAATGNTGVLKILLPKVGVGTDEAGQSLLFAADAGRMSTLKILLASGVSPNVAYKDGPAALASKTTRMGAEPGRNYQSAGMQKDYSFYNALTERGPTALMQAVRSQNLPCVQMLLDAGADVNQTIAWKAPNSQGATGNSISALSIALADSDLTCAGALLKAKANPDVDALSEDFSSDYVFYSNLIGQGLTVLMQAVKSKNMSSVQLLLAAGADVNKTAPWKIPNAGNATDVRVSALSLAVYAGDSESMSVLLKAGADPNASAVVEDSLQDSQKMNIINAGFSGQGPTILMQASESKNASCVQLLLGAGADVNRVVTWKFSSLPEVALSALSFAVDEGDPVCVNALLKAKANPNVSALPDISLAFSRTFPHPAELPFGTVLQQASREGKGDIVDALRKAGATDVASVRVRENIAKVASNQIGALAV